LQQWVNAIDGLVAAAPKAKVVFDRRYVDNGKVITTAGLSSGIDGALHLVERREGRGEAENLALHLEYQWDPASIWARAALADRFLRFRPDGLKFKYLRRAGDRTRWEDEIELPAGATPAQVAAALRESFAASATRFEIVSSNGQPAGVRWTSADEAGHVWAGEARFGPSPEHADRLALRLRVALQP